MEFRPTATRQYEVRWQRSPVSRRARRSRSSPIRWTAGTWSSAAAEEAARRRGDLEQAEAVEVDVREDEVHGIDEESRGMRIAFFSLGGLLITVLALIVVIALIASLTGFGS
jgi:hypothetical protein